MENNKSLEVFRNAPVKKAVFQNALPAMAAMLMVLIYNLADTFFIGQTHDDLQVAAVSLATPVFLIFMAVGTIFGIGGTSVISRSLGEGRKEYAKKVCSFCMWSCVGVGLLMSVLFLVFMNQILTLVGASADTWEYAKTYLTIVSVSGPFVLIANCYSNVIRAEGESGKAMMGQLLGNLLNVILDPIMILGFKWNIEGAAIATVIGNVVGACYYIFCFLRGKSALSIKPKDFTCKDKVASGVLAIGIPAALGSLLMSGIQHHYEQPNGEIRRYGGSRCRRSYEGNDDDGDGLYWIGARRSAAARILCRCKKVGQIQKCFALLPYLCAYLKHDSYHTVLFIYRADCQRLSDKCRRLWIWGIFLSHFVMYQLPVRSILCDY